jgi:hypothetical protein
VKMEGVMTRLNETERMIFHQDSPTVKDIPKNALVFGPTRGNSMAVTEFMLRGIVNQEQRKEHFTGVLGDPGQCLEHEKHYLLPCGWVCTFCRWSCTDDSKRCLCKIEHPQDAYVYEWDCPKHGYSRRYP